MKINKSMGTKPYNELTMSEVVIYEDGDLSIEVSVENETLWLSAEQIATVFDVNRPAIVKHIGNIYKSDELSKDSSCSILEQVAKDGKKRKMNFYNLDIVIATGYRVNSKKATKFRQWAISVLKQYITEGYVINSDKITHQRFKELEGDVELLKSKIKLFEDKNMIPTQGIFYDGQVFDAYVFVSDLIKSAKHSIKLVDNYIDESVLTLFSKNPHIKVTIYTKNISKQLKLDLKKYNTQYHNIDLKKFDASHDRFMIIDETEVYHIGASLKDLGKRWFAFSKMRGESLGLMGKLV